MASSFKLRLPSKRDWWWVLGLVALGTALGFGLNALSPVGINLRIALDLDEPPADATPVPTPVTPPAPKSAASPAARATL